MSRTPAARHSILVVDDDAVLGSEIEHAFAQIERDVKIDVAFEPAAAIELLVGATYSLVVLDLVFPRASGFDVLARMGTSAAPCPVIVVSRHLPPSAETLVKEFPFVRRVLSKPVEPASLVREILQTLE